MFSERDAKRIASEALEIRNPIQQDALILSRADEEFPRDPVAKLAIYGELAKLENEGTIQREPYTGIWTETEVEE